MSSATDQLKRDFCKCVERATFAPDAEAGTTSCGAPQQMELFAS